MSAADVKMEIPVLVRSLKSSILSSTSFQMGITFWGVVNAAVEQSRSKANMVAQGHGKFGHRGWPQNSLRTKKRAKHVLKHTHGVIFPLCLISMTDIKCLEAPPPKPWNGFWFSDGSNDYLSEITYSCGTFSKFDESGASDQMKAFCQWDKTWSLDSVPQCKSKQKVTGHLWAMLSRNWNDQINFKLIPILYGK